MDPLTIAMLGSTALSALGSFMGANESSNTNRSNQQIAMMNYQQQERDRQEALRARMEAMQLAERARGESQLGMTTAEGDRVYFDPQRGWVTSLGPITQALQGRNIQAGTQADALLRELQRFQPMTGERMSGLLYDKATRGINEAFEGQLAQGLRTATRQGNTRLAGELQGQSSKRQGEALRDAAINAELQGRQYADTFNTGQRNALANLYSAFAQQAAGKVGPTQYIPGLASQAGGATNAAITAAMASRPTVPTMQSTQPDNAWASALSSVGQLGYGAAKDYLANQNYQTQLGALQSKYIDPRDVYTRNTGFY